MTSLLINEIDTDARLCQDLVTTATMFFNGSESKPEVFILDLYDWYYTEDQETTAIFVDEFMRQGVRLRDLSSCPEILTTEVTNHLLSFTSKLQTKLYLNRLRVTIKLLTDLLTSSYDLAEKTRDTYEYITRLYKGQEQGPSCDEYEWARFAAASRDIKRFLFDLDSLPVSSFIILNVLCDLAGHDMPPLPYLEELRFFRPFRSARFADIVVSTDTSPPDIVGLNTATCELSHTTPDYPKPPRQAALAMYFFYRHHTEELPPFKTMEMKKEYERAAEPYGLSGKNFQIHYNRLGKTENRIAEGNRKALKEAIEMLHNYPKSLAMAKDELNTAITRKPLT